MCDHVHFCGHISNDNDSENKCKNILSMTYCICPNAAGRDEQLIQSRLFPSNYKQSETAFAFSVLDDFLTDSLVCKNHCTAILFKALKHYQSHMFPESIPVCCHSFSR